MKFGSNRIWKAITEVFTLLPLAATVVSAPTTYNNPSSGKTAVSTSTTPSSRAISAANQTNAPQVFLVSGGISEHTPTVESIQLLRRDQETALNGAIHDLTMAQPDTTQPGFTRSVLYSMLLYSTLLCSTLSTLLYLF